VITKAGLGSWVEKEEARQRRQERQKKTRGKGNKMFIDDSDLVFDR